MVLEADPSGRRIRLSIKAIREAMEKQDAQDYAARQEAAEAQDGGFGSIGETLRSAMEERDE
jgi:ribosomal protein S1